MTSRAVLIAGPTASGKSALALRLAARLGGVIVNADSMQVYRDLRIITARPSEAEEAEASHALYGHVDGAVNHSVGRYLADARQLLAALADEGRTPIVVGGTGLYFKALVEGLSDMPAVPPAVRDRIRGEAEGVATPALHERLARLDAAAAARLSPSDRLRILRALEIIAATGHAPTHFHSSRAPGPLAEAQRVAIFLAPERAWLHRRIDERFERMIAAGALDEVAALAARRLDPALPIMRAHGVPALMAHLDGRMSLAEAIACGQADTRAYVKRQFTWFRRQAPDFVWVKPEEAEAQVIEMALSPAERSNQ